MNIASKSYNFVLDGLGKLMLDGKPIQISATNKPGVGTWIIDGINFFLHRDANGKIEINAKMQRSKPLVLTPTQSLSGSHLLP